MKTMKRFLIAAAMLACCVTTAMAQAPEPKPEQLTLTLARIADSGKAGGTAEYVFVINGQVAYRTLEGLKKYMSGLPKGSVITWAPGCCRMGDEPLLSSRQQMEQFKAFCASCGISLVIVPSG